MPSDVRQSRHRAGRARRIAFRRFAAMSIVRIGLAETRNFAEGYDRIFGKKDDQDKQPEKKDENAPAQQDQPQEQPKK
jgi:hypothetical protein